MTQPMPPGPLSLVILGDSIGYGQGASRAADTIGARLVTALGLAGVPVALSVVAVPGARSEGLRAQVRAAGATHPGVALIVIGANDVTHLVPPDVAAGHLGEAVRALSSAGAQVVVAPAPDLSSVPWVPPQFRALARAGSTALRQAQTRAALAAGARVAHTDGAVSEAFAADPGLFSADRFHPSSAGYALITSALLPAVRAAAADWRRRSSGDASGVVD